MVWLAVCRNPSMTRCCGWVRGTAHPASHWPLGGGGGLTLGGWNLAGRTSSSAYLAGAGGRRQGVRAITSAGANRVKTCKERSSRYCWGGKGQRCGTYQASWEKVCIFATPSFSRERSESKACERPDARRGACRE